MAFSKMREAVRDYELGMQPSDDVDFEFLSPNQFTGPNIGLIPVQNGVQPTRLFYGARFANQAQPLVKPEAPWVQTLVDGEKDTSFDDKLGTVAGALRANEDLEIDDVLDNIVHAHNAAGEKRKLSLYKYMPFNRYSGLQQTPVVQKGQSIPKGGLLARSNFTDDKGSLALGLNARVGLVAYKGHSMDDAIVVSSDFAKRATSHHIDTLDKDFSTGDLKAGKGHFLSLFPEKYTRDQLGRLDDLGVVQPGQIVQPGDPLILATRPRSFNSSQSASFGRLGKVARTLRSDSSLTWDQQDPGTVMDVVTNKNGTVKVVVESMRPMRNGDKVALRSGQKGIVSKILQPEEMPRTADGQPLEVLLNHQGIPSRANPSIVWEILLGKIAAKTGKPLKLPAFNNNDESWLDYVEGQLKQHGLTDKEVVFDPAENRKLEKPITVGNAYLLKLHHLAEKKVSGRGQASYDQNEQASRGSGEGAKSKRRSGLEVIGMLSSGAVHNLREGSTLSGQRNDDYWKSLRAGQSPKPPGIPFVFHKFRALLNGAGLHARDMGDGKLRLGLMTDKELDRYTPLPVRHGRTINFRTLQPEAGGLFDPSLVGSAKWGAIDLPEPMPNPAAEDVIRAVLGGLTKARFEAILAGEEDL